MVRLVVSAMVALSSFQAARANDALNLAVSEAFDFAGEQLTVLKEETLVSNDMFTDYTNEEGEWRTVKESGNEITQTVWTSGMVAGMYWYQYEATGDIKWKEYAEDIQIGLEGVEVLDDNDLGFQVLNSFGLGYRLVGTDDFKQRTLTGAQTLYDNRYESLIPAVWSWSEPTKRPEWEMAVNVDMIMNMEILLWAAENGGSSEDYQTAAEGHANTTWTDIVREEDYSTFHVADYDPDTGDLVDQGTYQGWQDYSTWSRGQAWAIYGHAMMYRYLGKEYFLERCKLLLGYFDNDDNLPEDNVPYADFDAQVDSDNPKDSSATAIVASALFEIFELTGEAEYLVKALEYLSSLLLSEEYFNPEATDGWEALLRKSTAAWGEPSTGSVTGDYFLLETMVRYQTMAPSMLLRTETEVSITDGTAAFFSEGENDVDISGLSEGSPVMIWFGVTLTNTDHVPSELLVEGNDESVAVGIPEPADGWEAGENIVSFSVDAGTFSAIDTVTSVTLEFGGAHAEATGVTVLYLVVGHKLNTSRANTETTTETTPTPAPSSREGVTTSSSPDAESSGEDGDDDDTAAPESNDSSSSSSEGAVIDPEMTCPSTDGVVGIESSNGEACCDYECGTCGGVKCTDNGELCCISDIQRDGEPCSKTGEAPCYI